jgi:DNA-binding NarL/FixJ family response regulator
MVNIAIMSPLAERRDWLLGATGAEPTIRIIGAAATFPFLRSLITEASADVAVIDLQSDLEPGVVREWLAEIGDLVPIVLAGDASAEQIIQAIKAIGSGLMILDGALLRQLTRGVDEDAPSTEPLTPRETQVLDLLADGLGNKEIAARLNISEHTIKFHIRSILGKLGASSRTEAVSRGLRSGLIEL